MYIHCFLLFSMMFCILLLIILSIWFLKSLTGKRSNSVGCLVGKTAIVTGGNSGIGYATSCLLASRGCKVIIADVVDTEKSKNAIKLLTGNQNIFTKHLDLSSLESVRNFAEEINKIEKKIDILINNAGVTTSENLQTSDGLNPIMQINYFGAFLLTHLLLDSLKTAGSARVIFLGSALAFFHNLSLNNLNPIGSMNLRKMMTLYSNSKLCDMLAAQEFGKKLNKCGIVANSVDPGFIKTNIFRSSHKPWWYTLTDTVFLMLLSRGPFIGAQTVLELASNEKLTGKTGGHYYQCREWFKPRILKNSEFCQEIWKLSEKLVQLKDDEKI
ncbi:hypothetical protein HHI36_012106 [Cryptolaemus montrouzieri]|uniref:Uncharacterized protein n=1 Tax=Cryptolaemus montrouzieri TaxID=559131 RepID=A0ABD2NDK7_9CUCU